MTTSDEEAQQQQQQQQRPWLRSQQEATPLLGGGGNNNNNKNPNVLQRSSQQEQYLKQEQQQQQQHLLTYTSLGSPSYNSNDSPAAPQHGGGEQQGNDTSSHSRHGSSSHGEKQKKKSGGGGLVLKNFVFYAIYAMVNVIIAVPGLYGYAAVIFNHPVFAPHMNALAKLVLFSSAMHQIGFLLFSSLDFAIGTVQDAGLIFLSSMANAIANAILRERDVSVDDDVDEETERIILSTTCVFLSAGTALLGLVLIVMGKFKLANAVSYLPMPVVGGYLAFIGFFCIQAGVALCISQPIVTLVDWKLVVDSWHSMLLALPGLLAGLLLTIVSRQATNDAFLPLTMVMIPTVFYVVIFTTGLGLEGARDGGWVGPVSPPVPVQDLFTLVDFSLVEWHLVGKILWTWVGMVFVVSFASCLDVAAISMDMGEALDTNRELATVGICNFMSGLTFGFTGSYIFSQTIFTYRTGVHSRWIGVLIIIVYIYVVLSPVNLLQLSPLFFFGSTLIFIGYDLLFEWFIEIRERVLLSEYFAIWFTFVAIQIAGVDAGIMVGVFFAIIESVVSTANTTMVHRVSKRSRAVWTQEENKLLRNHAYHVTAPQIVTLEIAGPVFFGSSLSLLNRMAEEVGIQQEPGDGDGHAAAAAAAATTGEAHRHPRVPMPASPHPLRSPHASFVAMQRNPSFIHTSINNKRNRRHVRKHPPKFCVLDLTGVSNFDASAARACFLQFAKMCTKKGIVVCAIGATPRIDWMLRAHGIAFESTEEEKIKARFETLSIDAPAPETVPDFLADHVLMFMTIHEALEFCEGCLIRRLSGNASETPFSSIDLDESPTLGAVFARILDSGPEEEEILHNFDKQRYHQEIDFKAGQKLFSQWSNSTALYVVLKGAVASTVGRTQTIYRHRQQTLSAAGLIKTRSTSQSKLFDPELHESGEVPIVATLWPVGGILGYSDLLLDRPYSFEAFATQNGTRVARISRSTMLALKLEDPTLDALLNRVLLRASLLDLANCTCDDV